MNLKIFKIIINFFCFSFLFSNSEPLVDYKQNKNYDIIEINIENAPVIDGHLNDAVWMNASSIQDFIQEDPLIFDFPTFKTEVKLLYDQKNIYLYAKLYHDNPENIAKHLCRRDDWMQCFEKASDWFTFDLDPMHSHNSGYSFAVNAAGVQVDATIVDELGLIPYDENWDGLWFSEVSIDEEGWNLEIKIPLSNFTSYQNDDWGLNFSRYTKAIDETSSWVVIPRHLDGSASKFGHMRGFSMDKQSRSLSIKPSFSGCKDYSNAIISQELTMNEEAEGLDLFNQENLDTLRFIPSVDFNFLFFNNTLLSATINPDYGQIELDPEDVNLTAYQTYYTEKRDFFLEDNFIFSLPVELFYSRRIGEMSDIQWASKMISQEYENFTFASIFSKEESRWTNISRLQKNFLSGNSFAGLTSTLSNRDNMLIKSLSLDAALSLFDNTLLFDGQILFSEDSLNMEQNKIGKGLSLEGNYIFPYTEYFFDFEYFDKSLNINELGYLERNNLINMEYGFKIRDLNPGSIIRSKSITISHLYQENIDHFQLKNNLIISGHLEFMNYLNFKSKFIHSDHSFDDYKTYDIEYDTFGPKIPSPAYNLYKFSFNTNELNKISLKAEYVLFNRKVNQWNNFTDHNNKYEFGIKLRPLHFLTSIINYQSYNRDESLYFIETIVTETLDNNGDVENESLHYVFSKRKGSTDIISVRLDGSISPKASIQLYTEYYKNHYSYSDWRVLDDDNPHFPATNELFFNGDGVSVFPLYFPADDNSEGIYLNPNDSPFFKADYRNLNLNCIFKWEYMPGTNFYLVWVYQKNVAGEKFDSIIDFLNYNEMENYNDIFENQSLHIKFDYWFNL